MKRSSRLPYTTTIQGVEVRIIPRLVGWTWEGPSGIRGLWSPTRGWAEWSAWVALAGGEE
jgi:hypothetical protein